MRNGKKAVALRLPEDLYHALREAAAELEVSVNYFVVESIAVRLKVCKAQTLYDSFTQLGEDGDAEVEAFFEAQREALSH